MVPLLRKDLIIFMKPQEWMVVPIVGVMILYSSSHFQSLIFFCTLFAVFYALYLASYDIRHRSQPFFNSLPISRRDFVKSRYIEGLIFTAAAPILAFLLQIVHIITGSGIISFYPDIIVSMGTVLLILAIFYPFLLTFGTTALYVSFIVIIMIMNPLIYSMKLAEDRGGDRLFLIILLACLLLYGSSYLLSVKIHKEKDL